MPTPPENTETLKLRGSWRGKARDKAALQVPTTKLPTRPKWLPPEAVAIWKQITPGLRGIVTEMDRCALSAFCYQYSRWLRLIDEADKLDVGSKEYSRVERLQRNAHDAWVALGDRLGLNPRARKALNIKKLPDRPPHGNSTRSYFKTT